MHIVKVMVNINFRNGQSVAEDKIYQLVTKMVSNFRANHARHVLGSNIVVMFCCQKLGLYLGKLMV